MEIGAFAMFDALGTKGIWERHDPGAVVRKFASIETRIRSLVDDDFGGPGHPSSSSPAICMKMVRLGFVSDTVVVAFVNKEARDPVFAVMMAARYAGEVARLGLEEPAPWAYRGVVSYGEFEIHPGGGFFVGPAVDEAAALYESAEAALVWLAPSARAEMTNANRGHFQGAMSREEHEVALHEGRSCRTFVASPFCLGSTPAEAAAVVESMLRTFDVTKPGVEAKRKNTEGFLRRHLDELVETRRRDAALLGNAIE